MKKCYSGNFKNKYWKSIYRLFWSLLFVLVGCAPAVRVLTPPIQKVHFAPSEVKEKILIVGYEKECGKCLKENMEAYLKEGGRFVVVSHPEGLSERQREEFIDHEGIKYVISGEIEVCGTGFRVGTWTSDYNAILSCQAKVIDATTDETIWSKKEDVIVEAEFGKGDIKKIVLSTACSNLANKILNAFMKFYEEKVKDR